MKKALAIILLLSILCTVCAAFAETRTIDLEEMTPAELLALKDQVEKEYSKATSFATSVSDQLSAETKKAFQAQFTDAESFSYPLFGLNTSRARTLYKVTGDCTAKFYDKSKITYAVKAFYYHDESADTYTLALLMFNDEIISKDDEALPKIIDYVDKATSLVISPYIK